MKLIDLYSSLLKTANMSADKEGFISVTFAGKTEPALVKGKRLALPLPERLRDSKELITIFHPLAENIMMKGESDVLEKFRTAMNIRCNFAIQLLLTQLLQLAVNADDHKLLNPDQQEFLSVLKKATKKTVEVFAEILDNIPADQGSRSFVSLYLKKGGKIGDRGYKRVGVVIFPLYEELKSDNEKVFGVKISQKDRDSFIALCEYVFPDIGVENAYNRGSNSTSAPYLDAMMQSILAVGSAVNDKLSLFENRLTNPEDIEFEAEWVPVFNDLSIMDSEVRKVPPQGGNGDNMLPEQSPQKTTLSVTGIPNAFAPQPMHQPVAFAAPVPAVRSNSNGKLSITGMLNSQPMQQQQSPFYNAPMNTRASLNNPSAPVYNNNFNQFNQPMQMQQQQPQGFNMMPMGMMNNGPGF